MAYYDRELQSHLTAQQQQPSQSQQRKSVASSPAATKMPPPSAVSLDGWSADSRQNPRVFNYNPFDEDDEEQEKGGEQQQPDPLHQQIFIIKGYLRQAAEAGRLDEVRILEGNLIELQTEADQRKQ